MCTFGSRERNKSHARKTRERKKHHMFAFRQRIDDLEEENRSLRMKIDTRYTATVLLGFSQGTESRNGETIKSSSSVCRDLDKYADSEKEKEGERLAEISAAAVSAAQTVGIVDPDDGKKVRRRGKYSRQEREIIRRERNRIHAKKTRDKKKMFLDLGDKTIQNLQNTVIFLREYLASFEIISVEELNELRKKDEYANLCLASLKEPFNIGFEMDTSENHEKENDDGSFNSSFIDGGGDETSHDTSPYPSSPTLGSSSNITQRIVAKTLIRSKSIIDLENEICGNICGSTPNNSAVFSSLSSSRRESEVDEDLLFYTKNSVENHSSLTKNSSQDSEETDSEDYHKVGLSFDTSW